MIDTNSTYSGRRRRIEQILEPFLGISSMVPTNASASFEPGTSTTSLMCSWADPETLTSRTLSVHIDAVADGAAKAADVREMIAEETVPGDEFAEIPCNLPGEFAFALGYLGRVPAIAGTCVVEIMPSPVRTPLTALAEPALEIARTVGCSAYTNDFTAPSLNTGKVTGAWTTADGWVYDPRTPPQQ